MKQIPALVETMYWDGHTIVLWPYHLRRLQKGIIHYGLDADEDMIRELIMHRIQQGTNMPQKVRLELSQAGAEITLSPFPRETDRVVQLGIATDLVISSALATGLKTTDRGIYMQAQAQALQQHCDDVLIPNEKGHWVETAIYNIIWQDPDTDVLFTPAEREGCIAGVMRGYLLEKDYVREAVLYPEILQTAKAVWVCNALRGILPVNRVGIQEYIIQNFPI
jgi:branched-subunit amino acid aminotransferase/4-amino-4-deoxychorismate lyase